MGWYYEWSMFGETKFVVKIFHFLVRSKWCELCFFSSWLDEILKQCFIFRFSQDLKAFNYYYHFAYPCLSSPIFERVDAPKLACDSLSAEQMDQLTKIYLPMSSEDRSFFIIDSSNSTDHSLKHFKLSDKITVSNTASNFSNANLDEIYFCFSDPCSNIEYGGWPLRLFLLMLTHLWYVYHIFINSWANSYRLHLGFSSI